MSARAHALPDDHGRSASEGGPAVLFTWTRESDMSSFGIYIIGFIIFTAGLAIAAYLLGAPPVWIGVGVIVMLGVGLLTSVSRTRRKDPPEA